MKDTIRLWLIKIVLAVVIIIATILAATQLKSPGQSQNPVMTAIGFCAFVALLKWKPAKPNSSTEIEVKPLDKRDDDSNV